MILSAIHGGLFALTLTFNGSPPEAEPDREPELAPAPIMVPASPPNPKGVPSEGVHAVGSSGVAPLPPPPPPVSPSTIARGSWRGIGWLAISLQTTGPLAGTMPARPSLISLGGGVEGGWRIRQWLALGAAFGRQPHEIYREYDSVAAATFTYRGFMSALDLAFFRFYAPIRGRFDPYIDVGGGLSFFNPARDRPKELGATVRASAGFDVWVSRTMTLGASGIYRVNVVDTTVGHAWQAALNLGLHW